MIIALALPKRKNLFPKRQLKPLTPRSWETILVSQTCPIESISSLEEKIKITFPPLVHLRTHFFSFLLFLNFTFRFLITDSTTALSKFLLFIYCFNLAYLLPRSLLLSRLNLLILFNLFLQSNLLLKSYLFWMGKCCCTLE